MRWARLLRAPERVEVLAVDAQTQKARIRRYGFEQDVPLSELVFEEEEPAPGGYAHVQATQPSHEGVSLNLHLTAGHPEVTFILLRDAPTPAFVGLYLRSGSAATWHPLWQEVFTPGLHRLLTLSIQTYPPPWGLRLYVLGLLSESSARLPEAQTYEAYLRPLFFARSGTFPIEWVSLSPPKNPKPLSERTPAQTALEASVSSYDFPRKDEIDLHIEKLAPHLASASGEVIFLYQKEVLERYLDWAYREKLPSVRVIHGKGELRLRQLLLSLCERCGWQAEILLTPPYSGGATRVSF
jgi:hypothetical protein